jgi:hypothetical protein
MLTEPAILKAVGVDLAILFPEEKQGHPLTPELLMDLRPVRQGTPGRGD